MNEEIQRLLESLNYEAFLQGSVDENEPENFFCFWDFQADDTDFYDDDATYVEYGYWIYSYSLNPMTCETMIKMARKIFKDNGWSIDGPGISLKSDNPDYTGKMITIYKKIKY